MDGLDPLALLEAAEEGKTLDAPVGLHGSWRGLPVAPRACDVRDNEGRVRHQPSLVAHPVEEVRARADGDVGQLDARLVDDALAEDIRMCADVAIDVLRPAPRSVAEGNEERALEAEPELSQAQRRVRRRPELVGYNDVRRVGGECALDGVHAREERRLEPLVPVRGDAHGDTVLGVERLPVRSIVRSLGLPTYRTSTS